MTSQALTIETASEFRIYAACLAAYNSGRLHGAWIDLEGKDADAVQIEINDMLARSPCPNVMRRKCPDCGTYQTDARPYRENSDDCDECGATLPAEFKPSAEEWAIHDHEGLAQFIDSEWPDLAELCELVEILADDDEDKRRGLLWLSWNQPGYLRHAIDNCEDVITRPLNVMEDLSDVAAEWYGEAYSEALESMPAIFRDNIDWKGIAHDLECNGDWREYHQGGERFAVLNANDC